MHSIHFTYNKAVTVIDVHNIVSTLQIVTFQRKIVSTGTSVLYQSAKIQIQGYLLL